MHKTAGAWRLRSPHTPAAPVPPAHRSGNNVTRALKLATSRGVSAWFLEGRASFWTLLCSPLLCNRHCKTTPSAPNILALLRDFLPWALQALICFNQQTGAKATGSHPRDYSTDGHFWVAGECPSAFLEIQAPRQVPRAAFGFKSAKNGGPWPAAPQELNPVSGASSTWPLSWRPSSGQLPDWHLGESLQQRTQLSCIQTPDPQGWGCRSLCCFKLSDVWWPVTQQ